FAADPQRLDRFEREARALASMSHPNIATLFALETAVSGTGSGSGSESNSGPKPQASSLSSHPAAGTAAPRSGPAAPDGLVGHASRVPGGPGGHSEFRIPNSELPAAAPAAAGPVTFLVMELIEGRSLDKLIPEGGLELGPFLELATPLAEAISAAHDKSVIHRDLKPSNVMVDGEGRVKVLDFGLAKLQQAEGVSDSTELPTEALTGVGTIVGTVPYMSPEQVEGKTVDHRTDIFSLGVLLYEMATGERPFSGSSQPALMSSILRDVPPSVVEMRADLPRHLGRVISRCLEKDRRDRYQTARDVYNELRALKRETSGHSLPSVQSRPRAVPVQRGSNRAIAVAPFRAPSKSEELTALAEGLAEDIAAGLARFPYLTILEGAGLGSSDSSTSAAAGLGARYVLRGGLRSAGSELRLSVQLVEVETGAHVWSETYDRRLDDVGVFELQDDLTDRIVATVGDYSGVIPRLVVNELRAMDDDDMTVDDWIMRAVCYVQVIHPPEEHAAIRDGLEKMVELHPDNAEAHAWLANTYVNEFAFGFNPLEDPIGRSLQTAQRAVDLDPTTQAGWLNLAGGHFFLGDLAAFEAAATRAITLNPRNSYAIAYMGLCFGNSGQRERGAELGTRACALNPHHPEWYPFVNFYHLYAREEYEAACSVIKRINWPKFPYTHINFAAACGQLGRPEEARTSIKTLRDTFGFDLEGVRAEFVRWGHTEDFIEHILDGLRKAGMDDGAGSPQSSVVNKPSQSKAVRPNASGDFDQKSIVVLPFINMSEDSSNEFFSDGVTEEILTSLSRIDGLRVISRTSAMTYKNTSKSIREIAAELEVGTVLEGSVRRAGNRVRVTAQLIEAASDRHLWSESYDRDLEDIFEVQSNVAVQIAQSLQTELASDVVAQIQKRPTDSMEAYDLYLKGRQGVRTLVAPEVARGIEQLEQAIALDPDFAAAWAHLSLGHLFSAYWGAARGRDDYDEARRAADRALELDPSSALARVGRAGVRSHLDLDWDGAVAELREAIEIDPTEIDAYFWLGVTLFLMGRFDESVATHEIAYSMDPHSPNVISQLGLALCFAGRQEEGERMLRDGIEQHPVFFDLPNFLAVVLKRRNLFDEAARWYDRTSELTGRHPVFEAIRASNLKLAGEEGEARRVLDRLDEDDPRMDSVVRAMRAIADRDIDGAVEYFSAAVDQRLPLVFWIRPAVHDKEFSANHPGVRTLWRRLWPQDPTFSRIEKPPETGSKAVAVLPFTDMSPGRDQEWFCEGVAEEILNALAAIPDLRVATRTAAFRFKDQDRDIAAIGQTLGVNTLLEGSVRTAGDRLRVTARLVNTDDGFQLWSEKFDREMADVFEIQDQIATRVVEALEISVLGSAEVGGSERHSTDIEAYHLYLKGRHARYSKLDLKTALECFEGAVRRDPAYSLARIGLAETLVVLSMYGFVPPNEGMTRARDELRQAGDATRESAEA
ncbi:MAG TPA: protein kinase, partial [Candidatus Sulfomarinibacteraceae bacterium]|nr:protein kinase [Candidatus Sulfomarinibacteraceae bacterium]